MTAYSVPVKLQNGGQRQPRLSQSNYALNDSDGVG